MRATRRKRSAEALEAARLMRQLPEAERDQVLAGLELALHSDRQPPKCPLHPNCLLWPEPKKPKETKP